MTQALDPAEFARTAAEIADLLSRGVRAGGGGSGVRQRRESLDQGYRWVHAQAYGLASVELGASTVCPHCHGTLTRLDNGRRCDECSPTDHADRTGDAVVGRQRAQEAAGRASKALEAAKAALVACTAVIRGETERAWDPIPTPRTEPRAGVKQALEAQQRRVERGEGTA